MDGVTVALVSTISSGVLGGLALYFGQRGRSQPFRQALYGKQLDLLLEATTLADRVHTACLRVHLANGPAATQTAKEAAFVEGREFQALLPKLSVLLPIEVWKAFVSFHEEVGRFLRDNPSRESRYASVTDLYARLATPVRKFAGVDPLSAENIKQFGSGGEGGLEMPWRLPPS